MKMIFAALASALLVSTAFAQTAAPAMSGDQQTQAAGQANLKAGGATSTDAAKAGASTKQRKDAHTTLQRVVSLAHGTSLETKPGRRLPWWRKPPG